MTFNPDRTANRGLRTCPSSNNHARHRLQLPLGAAAARRGRCDLQRLSYGPKEAGGPIRRHSFDNSKYNNNGINGAMRRPVADLAHQPAGGPASRCEMKAPARDASN